MQDTSLEYKRLVKQPAREFRLRGEIRFKSGEVRALTPECIVSADIQETVGDHLPLGAVSASTIRLCLDNRRGEWGAGGSLMGTNSFDGAILALESGIKDESGVFHFEKAGTFVLEQALCQEQDLIAMVTGADALGNKAERIFNAEISYPTTLLGLLQKACEVSEIPLKSTAFANSDFVLEKPIKFREGMTCRGLISYIAQVACGFAKINRSGELEIKSFKPNAAAYALTPENYISLKTQGLEFGPLNALSVYPERAPRGYGATRVAEDISLVDNELNSIAIKGNPILAHKYPGFDSLVTKMLQALKGLEFQTAELSWFGDLTLETGDRLKTTNLKGEALDSMVLSQSISLGTGFLMHSSNRLDGDTKSKAKAEHTRVFTPTGKLNATVLEGDINIRSGEQINILAGGKIVLGADGDIVMRSGKALDEYADEAEQRLTAAEQLLTPENITQTVRSSKAYLADLEKKAGKHELEDLATHAEVSEAKETAIRQSDESIRLEVTRERQRAEAVEGEIKSFTDTAQTYFEFKVDGLKIGKSGSQFHTLHSDEEVGFYQSGSKVAYIRHNKLYILSAEILEKLIIGNQTVGFTEIFTADGGIRAVYHN